MDRPFAVFDIDGTLIRWQMYHAIVDALARQGHMFDDSYQSIRAARMLWKRRIDPDAFKSYERKLVKAYERVLINISYSQFCDAVNDVFSEYKDQVYVYTRDLITELKQKGYVLFAISGSQTEIVQKIADYWGFDDFTGTTYEVKNDQFTGKVSSHLGKKHLVIRELAAKHHVAFDESIGVGDSEGDISMLGAIAHPIAFNPSRKLYDHAGKKGWPIVIERKNVVYKLELQNGQYILAQTDG